MRKTVVVNGFHRTGSTLVYMLAQEILRQNSLDFAARGAQLALVDRAIAEHKEGWLTIKTHRWMPTTERPDVVVFYTTRDLADVARSYLAQKLRHGEAMNSIMLHLPDAIILQSFFDRYCASKFAMHTVVYEEWYGRPGDLAEWMAGKMGLPLADKAPIDCQFSAASVKAKSDAMLESSDGRTELRRHHIAEGLGRPNGSLDDLPPAIRELLGHC